MHLSLACIHILRQLTDLTQQIRVEDFVRPASTLSGSTIGQHLRHTLEFFLCLETGFLAGVVDYDKRAHDKLIETDKQVALSAIERVKVFVSQLKEKALELHVGYSMNETYVTVETTAMRELVYNIEHAVHHMAIIKIGVREIASYITLDADFGIAASTIRHKEAVAAH